ncbi:MAG: phage tail tube protein [Treponema sp.]|nr:phage tail tube protein [Candidatus Treponema caballi]
MANNSNITGIYKLEINSSTYPLKEAPSFSVGGEIHEEQEINSEFLATSTKYVNPYIEGTIANFANVSMATIQAISGATVVLFDPNGKKYVFRQVKCVNQVVNDGNGGLSFRLVGEGKAEELK